MISLQCTLVLKPMCYNLKQKNQYFFPSPHSVLCTKYSLIHSTYGRVDVMRTFINCTYFIQLSSVHNLITPALHNTVYLHISSVFNCNCRSNHSIVTSVFCFTYVHFLGDSSCFDHHNCRRIIFMSKYAMCAGIYRGSGLFVTRCRLLHLELAQLGTFG